jgi:hypothetical protein
MVLTTAEKWRRRRRRVEMTTTTTTTMTVKMTTPSGKPTSGFALGTCEQVRLQAVSAWAGPSLSSGIRAAKDYPFSTTRPSNKALT